MTVEIECLHCLQVLDIPSYVDTKGFDGEIRCKKCEARLAIKFIGSEKPAKYKLVEKPPHKNNPRITQVETVLDVRPIKDE